MTTIAIIGLGYVGLPLALRFAEAGVRVIGLDIDPKKVDALNAGTVFPSIPMFLKSRKPAIIRNMPGGGRWQSPMATTASSWRPSTRSTLSMTFPIINAW
jgi:glycine/D-amino acid oxidase-like deaminating enzyme